MRTAFIRQLAAEARRRPEIFLVVGDLGYSVVEPFAKEFPDRFLNAGVAEQNMTGVAAGLASEGYHVFTYSIANFPTLRCFEQVRNDICYQRLPVTVVSVGAGMAYGNLGYSHHAVQDLGVMCTLPFITVLAPADPGEVRECVAWLADHPGPSYLRLGKANESDLHAVRGIAAGPLHIRPGDGSCAIVATGSVLAVGLAAAELAARTGRQVAVFSCPWLKPTDAAFFRPLSRFRRLVVLDEHVAEGGLASILRASLPDHVHMENLFVPETLADEVGSQQALRRKAGLDADQLVRLLTSN